MIKVKTLNGVLIETSSGTSAEIERNSPFFSNGDEWAGEKSTPITFPYTKETAQELGYPFVLYSKRLKNIIDADLFDGTFYRQRGKLITDSSLIDQNNIHKSQITGYFVFALSSFYQLIKDKKLRELSLGGKRTFSWTTSDPDDSSDGFWQYLHSTWDGTKEILVAPLRNEALSNDLGTLTFMNLLDGYGKLWYDSILITNHLYPQINVKYLVTKIFEEHGYSVEFDVDDTQWEKLFLPSLIPFDWRNVFETVEFPGIGYEPKASIDVFLNNHLPDKTIIDFLIQLFIRFGWRPLINDYKKTCRIKSFRAIKKGSRKDWTAYFSKQINSEYNEDPQNISFKNEIDSGDSAPVKPEFDGKKILPSVNTFDDLPAAAGINLNNICYTFEENSWWIVKLEGTDYYWAFYGDNIFDAIAAGENQSISTTVSTLPVARSAYRTVAEIDYYGLFPIMKQDPGKEFGYRVLFYHGMVPDMLSDGSPGTGTYPHLSPLYSHPGDAPDLTWSNIFVHDINSVKKGIIEYWFKDWIPVISQGEDIKAVMSLTRNELLNFSWDDVIIIRNIPFLVKSIVEPIPYRNKAEVTLRRIG